MSASNRKAQTGAADPIIQTIADEDSVRWYSKPNLRYLYLMLFPTCLGIELTSGFDSQMINALQIVPAWQDCKLPSAFPKHITKPTSADCVRFR